MGILGLVWGRGQGFGLGKEVGCSHWDGVRMWGSGLSALGCYHWGSVTEAVAPVLGWVSLGIRMCLSTC